MPGEKANSMDQLLQALAGLDTPEECRAFLKDLCTIKELRDMAQRFETAILLSEGRNYQEISAQVGTSSATISRVSQCLNYGSGGYRAAIQRLKEGSGDNADQ